MPNSLTANHSSALVCSTRPRVSVYGTDALRLRLSGFSRRHGYPRSPGRKRRGVLSRSARGMCFTVPLYAYALKRPIPYGRGGVTTASPRRTARQWRNVHRLAIGFAYRLGLRIRLTPGRLASPGKPWSYGGGESHPPYRYLCLHLLFMTLQPGSRLAFKADMNAPLPLATKKRASPRLRQAAYTRLLSTPRSSTSELLRTL